MAAADVTKCHAFCLREIRAIRHAAEPWVMRHGGPCRNNRGSFRSSTQADLRR